MHSFSIKSVLVVLFFFMALATFAQKEKAQLALIIKKLNQQNYVGIELQSFYRAFSKQIKAPVWTDEPPAKLQGVFFKIKNSSAYFDIDLNVIPGSARVDTTFRWTMKSVGKSTIESVRLMKGRSVIYALYK